jgi:hypothetical protein
MREVTENKLKTYIKIITFLSLICAVILSGCAHDKPEIKINYNSNTAKTVEDMEGIAENIPEGYELWIIVNPDTTNTYYPQSQPVKVQNEKWSVPVIIDTKDNAGGTFNIIAVLADQKARAEFTSYNEKCKRDSNSPGMDKIPDGATSYDEITVVVNNPTKINITYPLNGAEVNIKETVDGTAENIPEGYKFWILVYPQAANKFYPQNKNVNIINGHWSSSIGLGTKDNSGEKFNIIAVLANEEAHKELTNYTDIGIKDNYWPGMDSIPQGAWVCDEVTVTRVSPPEINITSPSNTTTIRNIIKGTAKNIPEGQEVWVIIYPYTAYKYYPIDKLNSQNGKWELPAQFGEGKDVDTQFDIIAVLADQMAQGEFNSYLETCRKVNQWPGMNNIPSSAKELARVTVTRI